jgi:hypothetical protein
MAIAQMLRSGLRFILSYAVVSVLCTIFIVVGNDILTQYAFPSRINKSILQVDYLQWLPVCAMPLLITALVYLLSIKLLPVKLPLFFLGLIGGTICTVLILFTGVCSISWESGWYEIKNLSTFFISGFSFAVLVELSD